MKNATIKLVRVYDPAFVGASRDAMKRYGETRDEADIPEPLPGTSPIVFHVRRLTRAEILEDVEAVLSDERRWARAFDLGVTRVTGGRFGDAGWEPAGASTKPRVPITSEELDEQQISTLDQKEIGGVIYAMSTRPFDCSGPYQLQRSSAVAWDGNVARYVARTREAAPPSNEPPKGE